MDFFFSEFLKILWQKKWQKIYFLSWILIKSDKKIYCHGFFFDRKFKKNSFLSWIFSKKRQKIYCHGFFSVIESQKSMTEYEKFLIKSQKSMTAKKKKFFLTKIHNRKIFFLIFLIFCTSSRPLLDSIFTNI